MYFPAGDRAVLIELGQVTAEELHGRAAALRRRRDVLACIPGATSLYVVCRGPMPDPRELDVGRESVALPGRTHEIDVNFGGADLEDLWRLVEKDEFFTRLPQLWLTARYVGFRAGFAYLDGWPAEWALPRRPTSRIRVPRGSFAVANAVAGFYPVESPGGWNLLGQTDSVLWDASRVPPNLITPGDRVRIIPVRRPIELRQIVDDAPPPAVPAAIRGRLAVAVGPADWRRIASGLSPGGPFDPLLAREANRLVGNEPDAPLIECAMGSSTIVLGEERPVAWAGAECDLPHGEPFAAEGAITTGRIRNGLRGWLAIGPRGGTGSRGSDRQRPGDRLVIRVAPGPHETTIRTVRCEVTPSLNRVGIRLRPLEPLPATAPANLPSCGMQFGTIQLHPDGSLVAMGPDHPVTGGYLQPLTVLWDERWKLAQLTPGERVVLSSAW